MFEDGKDELGMDHFEVRRHLSIRRHLILSRIESETGKTVVIRGDPGFTSDQMECVCEDARGRQVPIGASGSTPPTR